MIDLIIAKYNLTNTQIREYIDKRYKSEKYRNILKERIIDGRKLEYLAIKYYGEDSITNKSIEFLMSEIVREKIFKYTEEEVPHSITCYTESVGVGKNSYNIRVIVVVDRESLKKIIIGKQGEMIKKIGIESRKDLEALMNKTVYLELFVKTVKKWREKEKYLNEFGFNDFEK